MLQLSGIDIRLIRLFVTVVECHGFSAAQVELNLSAPTISTHMRSLETRLGVRLCERGRSGFSLTPHGESIYIAAKRLLGALNDFSVEAGVARRQLVGELRLGMVDALLTNRNLHLANAISIFLKMSPDLRIHISTSSPNEIEKQVIDGYLHAGLGSFHRQLSLLAYHPVILESQGLFCGVHHPLFTREPHKISLKDIENCNYVDRSYMTDTRTERPFLPLKTYSSVGTMEAIATLILSGHFIGHLPVHYAQYWTDRLEMTEIRPDIFRFDSQFHIVSRAGRSRSLLLDAFIQALQITSKNHTAAENMPIKQ
ncbi:LysR family transcriptional regulator [Acidocella sp. KAb 2-4]|uniref:LysR family transcriptional regulator n=1 Tax=Acidocella sp. KAb 2-4 TaxID=2885158 RepID=UPI001D070B9C|nr:LysR family transcriptional regulator [Acidocella sp. KAb 2-4]MCB5944385.1 LysR family transcriptional regulator [Acidocella sp. KAb 2-4]